jgi:hypothetical protein
MAGGLRSPHLPLWSTPLPPLAEPCTTTDTDWDAATITAGANGYRLLTEMEWMWDSTDKCHKGNTPGPQPPLYPR